MRKLYLLFFVGLATVAMAEPVDVSTARSKVATFLAQQSQKGLRKAPLKGKTWRQTLTTAHADKQYYVFNVGDNDGFVVTAADDAVQPVLGYTTSGRFSEKDMPEGMRGWFKSISAEVAFAAAHGKALQPAVVGRKAVSPLLSAKWNQNSPYNDQCPLLENRRCYTGCVATALAQVLFYHKWPQGKVAKLPAYEYDLYLSNGRKKHVSVDGLPATQFDWSALTDVYNDNSGEQARAEVAKLMRYAGQALQMQYDVTSSGTTMDPDVIKKYFGYDNGMRTVKRKQYSREEWEKLIYAELQAKRPVLYGGSNDRGGHAYVVDGYDGNGMFHVNWGWGGSANGYFLLSLLNPNSVGIGASAGSEGFNFENSAVVGIQPPNDVDEQTEFPLVTLMGTMDSEEVRDGRMEVARNEDGTFTLPDMMFDMINYKPDDCYIAVGAVCVENAFGEVVQTLQTFDINTTFTPSVEKMGTWKQFIVSGKQLLSTLSDGIYRIKIFGSKRQGGGFLPLEETRDNFVEAVIEGNTLKLHHNTSSDILVINSHEVIGSLETGEAVTLRLNVTNNSLSNNNPPLFLYVNGSSTFSSRVGTHIDAGTTGTVDIHFTPFRAGDYRLKISPIGSPSEKVTPYMIELTAQKPAKYDLEGVLQIDNSFKLGDKVCASGTDLKLSLKVTNNGNANFNNNIMFDVYSVYNGSYERLTTAKVTVELSKGETKTVETVVNGLQTGKQYCVNYSYRSEGLLQRSYLQEVNLVESPFVYNGVLYRKNVAGNTVEVVDYTAVITTASPIGKEPTFDYRNGYNGMVNISPVALDGQGNSFRVTGVAASAFANTENLKVVLPAGLTEVKANAFQNNTGLEIYALSPKAPTQTDAFSNSTPKAIHLISGATGYETWGGTKDNNIGKRTFTDGQTADIPADGNVYEMTFTRALKNKVWNVLTLPFDTYADVLPMYFGEQTEVAVFDPTSTVDHINFTTVKSGLIPAGTPFLVKPGKEGNSTSGFTMAAFMGTQPVAQGVMTDDGMLTLKGTFNPTAVESGKAYLIANGGKYTLATGDDAARTVTGFAAYLYADEPLPTPIDNATITVNKGNTTTAVTAVTLSPAVGNNAIYNLQGQRMQLPFDRLPAGIYIVGGKKVVKK